MLKVEVQYVDFGNIEALPLASLREPTRAISHVNSLPFQVIHPTCLFVPCSPPPLTLSPFSYPTPMSYCVSHLLLSSLTGTPPYLSSPTLTLSSYECPTPLVVFHSPLALFPYRYPSLIVFLFLTSLCSL